LRSRDFVCKIGSLFCEEETTNLSWLDENKIVNLQHEYYSKKKKHLPGIIVDPNMRDYSKEPYFVEKHERARSFIAKHGVPKDWVKKPK
jgi:hypothetical protein